ncbi:N-acetylneuraminate lyase-like isoform X2 [Lineus longissimus]|uniref:N-acetylneuraminate lyase-like isoform X2 n=1 Tax=Lineus longissimus TaxID=88925 RepID=UPI002B4DA9DE
MPRDLELEHTKMPVTDGHDNKVCGLVAAVFTPFNANGDLNLDVIEPYIDHLYENQVVNVFVNGTTGEGLSMTIEERKRHAEMWVKAGAGKLDKIIIHVGSHNLIESKDLATHAQEIGASAIAALPSFFFKPQSAEDLVEYCRQIAECAPDLPFYYYHLPRMTGVTLNMVKVFELAKDEIPTLHGIKYSDTSFDEACKIMDMHGGKYQVFCGADDVYLGAMALGIDWAVGSTYNFLSNVVHRMVEAFNKSDNYTARVEQKRVQDVISIRNKYGGGVAELKEIFRFVGPDVGPPRFPLKPLSAEKRDGLKQELTNIGFFYWTKDHLTPPQSPLTQRTKDKRRTLHRATSLLTDDGDPPSSPKATTDPHGSFNHSHSHGSFSHGHHTGSMGHGTKHRHASGSSSGSGSHLEKQTSNTSLLTEG